jgi:hypothetical protein
MVLKPYLVNLVVTALSTFRNYIHFIPRAYWCAGRSTQACTQADTAGYCASSAAAG